MGDINADGIRDYAFVTTTDESLSVRVVLGDLGIRERNWNGHYWDSQPTNQRLIEIPHVYLGSSAGPSGAAQIGLHVLPFFNDTTGTRVHHDVLLYSATTDGVHQNRDGSYMTGLIYSGELLGMSGTRFGIYDRSGDIIHETAGATGIQVMTDLTGARDAVILSGGTSVDMIESARPAVVTTVGNGGVRGVLSNVTLNFDLSVDASSILASSTYSSTRLNQIRELFEREIARSSTHRNRIKVEVVPGTRHLRFESVERAAAESFGLHRICGERIC